MALQLEQRLLTVEEYHKMAEAGILSEDDRVELLNGQIIKMSPIGSKHAACVEKIGKFLDRLLIEKAMVRSQNPVVIGRFSEPEPDIAIVSLRDDFYAERHPHPKDVFLIIEVADSSLETDRQAKLPIYAAAGIPEYWIVNLEERQLEVFQAPEEKTYRSKQLFYPGDSITWQAFNLTLPVEALLV